MYTGSRRALKSYVDGTGCRDLGEAVGELLGLGYMLYCMACSVVGGLDAEGGLVLEDAGWVEDYRGVSLFYASTDAYRYVDDVCVELYGDEVRVDAYCLLTEGELGGAGLEEAVERIKRVLEEAGEAVEPVEGSVAWLLGRLNEACEVGVSAEISDGLLVLTISASAGWLGDVLRIALLDELAAKILEEAGLAS